MSKLVVVANRGPASLYRDDDGVIRARHAAGGLAPSLSRALAASDGTWVAGATSDLERHAATHGMPEIEHSYDLQLVAVEPQVVDAALRVIANGILWFCHHDLFDRVYRPNFSRVLYEAWDSYRQYNAQFAEAVDRCADEGATVVVNDYHLCLVGRELSRRRPDLRTVHFSHTPFCSPEELRVLPQPIANELISGLSSFGACGFHTERWANRFRECAHALDITVPSVFVSPLGVDAKQLQAVAKSAVCSEKRDQLRSRLAERKLILRNDRLELSKNVLRGFLAFEEFLTEHDEWVGRAVFLARLYPSREDIPEYLAYRASVESVVERINERFGSGDYLPIDLDVDDDFEASVAASSLYDLLLVNPVRDGMNLVAKEGPILNANDGVLALSTEAGAFAELGGAALAIEPFDVLGTANAIEQALTMSASERKERMMRLKTIASFRPPEVWFEEVVERACRPGEVVT